MRRMFTEKQVKELALEGLVGKDVVVKSLTSDGGPIIEGMSGYSFDQNTGAGSLNWTPIYVGAVKNGNKITLVVFGTYTYATGDSSAKLGDFVIPSEIGAKLYPYTIGGETRMLDKKEISFYSTRSASKAVSMEIIKNSGTKLEVTIIDPNYDSLVDGTTYSFRYEVTFLLSENLAE